MANKKLVKDIINKSIMLVSVNLNLQQRRIFIQNYIKTVTWYSSLKKQSFHHEDFKL